MIEIPLIDELCEVRRRLSEEQQGDPERYAAMLRQVAQDLPGSYVTERLHPDDTESGAESMRT